MTYRELRRILESNGWLLKNQNGSIALFKKDGSQETVVVPMHNTISIGVLMKIEKNTGLSLRPKK